MKGYLYSAQRSTSVLTGGCRTSLIQMYTDHVGASYCTSVYTSTIQGGGSRRNGSLRGWNPCDMFLRFDPGSRIMHKAIPLMNSIICGLREGGLIGTFRAQFGYICEAVELTSDDCNPRGVGRVGGYCIEP